MVFLGRPVVFKRHHFGDNFFAEETACAHLLDDVLRHLLLVGIGVVNAAAVLGAHIIALLVQGGGIVHHEEDFKDLARADLRRVISEFDHFIAASAARAHLLVARLRNLAIAVTAFDIGNAAHLNVDRFGTPKTAATQHDGF